MHASLDKFIQPESVEYVWEGIGKAESNKFLCLKHLPNTIVFQCNRFVLNYETFETTKLNSKYEYPRDINLFKWTSEGIKYSKECMEESGKKGGNKYRLHPKEYYEFKLVGVVVHNGTATFGHYYSFIKDREQTNESERWFRFDDARVTPFHPDYLENETFGGSFESSELDEYGWRTQVQRERTCNAYLLVYERDVAFTPKGELESDVSSEVGIDDHHSSKFQVGRGETSGETSVKTSNVSIVKPSDTIENVKAMNQVKEEIPPGQQRLVFNDKDEIPQGQQFNDKDDIIERMRALVKKDEKIASQNNTTKKEVPPHIFEQIFRENEKYLNDTRLLNLDFFNFVLAITKTAVEEEKDNVPEDFSIWVSTFFLNVLCHSILPAKEEHLITSLGNLTAKLLTDSKEAAVAFLQVWNE